ncbi:MAG TPA: cytochrome c4 [Stenotrophomonas sp.]|nr:cytochrome c4 [Stenotrophomonas sp.]
MKRPALLLFLVAGGLLGLAHAANGADDDAPAPPLHPRYLDLRTAPRIAGDAAAGKEKSLVCSACHGEDGGGTAPPFPNIGGQRADFFYWQLVELKRGRHPSPMTPLVSTLDDQDMRDLAAYYASLPLHPAAAGASDDAAGTMDAALLEKGRDLYLHGDPAKGIPPCQGCHGPDARGMPGADVADRNGRTPYAAFPVLRGQQAAYLQTKLGEYRAGDLHDSTGDFIMSGVGKRLDEDSIQAVSAWLSSLRED